jgi:hypothetical protein
MEEGTNRYTDNPPTASEADGHVEQYRLRARTGAVDVASPCSAPCASVCTAGRVFGPSIAAGILDEPRHDDQHSDRAATSSESVCESSKSMVEEHSCILSGLVEYMLILIASLGFARVKSFAETYRIKYRSAKIRFA